MRRVRIIRDYGMFDRREARNIASDAVRAPIGILIAAVSVPLRSSARCDRSVNNRCESDHLLAPLLERALDQVDVAPDTIHVGVDLQRTLRIPSARS